MLQQIGDYYVAAGMNSSGLSAAGGVGKYLSEWIVDGQPSVNLWSMDVQRFVDLHNNKKFLKERVVETQCEFKINFRSRGIMIIKMWNVRGCF